MVHRNALSSVDLTAVDGIPVTTPARTLIDIASVSPRDVVEEALDDALRRGLVSISRVRWRLDALGGGRCGVAFMRALLDDRDPAASVPQSGFERRLLRILKRAGFPDPVHEERRRVTAGRMPAPGNLWGDTGNRRVGVLNRNALLIRGAGALVILAGGFTLAGWLL
ncbi:MAG: hypothetical protein ACXVQ6_10080, partial [Actinomycetota bacterium]